jgi:D-arabinose 1-dehydrogenase-like Zn-dependent alcohol dehydrogenase
MAPVVSRAALFHGPNQPFTFHDVPLPALAAGEVLVRIRLTTLCGSDLHSHAGRRSALTPSILGHEMVGGVEALGQGEVCDEAGWPLALGDRVTWDMGWSCGACAWCHAGLRAQCERRWEFGHHRFDADHPALAGGLAQHCVLPAGTAIFRVPAIWPDTVAAPSNCATATVAAAVRQAGAPVLGDVLVAGAGMLGLTAHFVSDDVERGQRRYYVRVKAEALRYPATVRESRRPPLSPENDSLTPLATPAKRQDSRRLADSVSSAIIEC